MIAIGIAAAAKIAAQLGAEVIVIGTAKISSGGMFYNMHSGQADINGKIVRADTGEILAVVPQARGKKAHDKALDALEKEAKVFDDTKRGRRKENGKRKSRKQNTTLRRIFRACK